MRAMSLPSFEWKVGCLISVKRPGAEVHPLDEPDLLLQRVEMKRVSIQRETFRQRGLPGLGIEPLRGIERLDFLQGEIDRVKASVRAFPLGELFCHIRHGVEVDVVQDDGHIILGEHHILFEKIRALRMGHRLGRQAVLWQVPAGTAMREDSSLGRG